MRVLIDTHVFLWMVSAPGKLSTLSKYILESEENNIVLSAVSGWEIAIKFQVKKLKLPENPDIYVKRKLDEYFIEVLPIEMRHVLSTYQLPGLHKDPFDRLLVAQSKFEKLPILTNDNMIKKYPIDTIW